MRRDPWPKSFSSYYCNKICQARRLKIPMTITKAEAWQLWQPYWNSRLERHHGYSGYCLRRRDLDRGFEPDNCEVVTHNQNSQERNIGKTNWKAGPGNPNFCDAAPRPLWAEGVYYPSIGVAARAWQLHKTTVVNRCDSENFPDWCWA